MKYIKKLLILSILVIPFFIGMKNVNAGWELFPVDLEEAKCEAAGYYYSSNTGRGCINIVKQMDGDSYSYCDIERSWINQADLECSSELSRLVPVGNNRYIIDTDLCVDEDAYARKTDKEIQTIYINTEETKRDNIFLIKTFYAGSICPDGYFTARNLYKGQRGELQINYCIKCYNYGNHNDVEENLFFDDETRTAYVTTCNILKGDFKMLWTIIIIIAPIMLILFGGFDVFKAVVASDEKEIKKAGSNFVKRILITLAIFILPTLVNILIGFTSYDKIDACLGSNLVSKDSGLISLVADSSVGKIESNTWTNKDVTLYAILLEEDSSAEYLYEWYIDGRRVNENSNEIKILASSNISGDEKEYNVKIIKKTENGKELLISSTFMSKIDTVSPTCTTTGGTNGYVNSSVTIKGICSDKDAECENISKTYDPINKEQNLFVSPGTVYDRAGNSAICDPVSVKINKIDSNTQ